MSRQLCVEQLQRCGFLPAGDYSNVRTTTLIKQLKQNPAVRLYEFDAECIENGWDYSRLFNALLELVDPPLAIKRVRSTLNREARTAHLSFQYQGDTIAWEFSQPDDWVSTEFLENIVTLVRAETKGELMSLPTADQFMCYVLLPKEVSF